MVEDIIRMSMTKKFVGTEVHYRRASIFQFISKLFFPCFSTTIAHHPLRIPTLYSPISAPELSWARLPVCERAARRRPRDRPLQTYASIAQSSRSCWPGYPGRIAAPGSLPEHCGWHRCAVQRVRRKERERERKKKERKKKG